MFSKPENYKKLLYMQVSNSLVSIIIPSYNRADLIERAISSALNQTYQNIEIVVVNDGSQDNTDEIVNSIKSDKIILISLEQNGGLSNARNVGIKSAKGEYVAFLDSDDEWDVTKTEKQMALLNNSSDEKLGAVYCYCYEKFEGKGKIVKKDEDFRRGELHNDFLQGYCPPSPTLFLVKRDALLKIGLFDGNIKNFEDLDLYIRLSEVCTFDYVPEYLATKYEHDGDQLATNIDSRVKGMKTFMAKWKNTIISTNGKKAYHNIRKHRLKALVEANLKSKESSRKIAIKCIRILISLRELKPRLYFKAILGVLFGVGSINKLNIFSGNSNK